jgi:hypothetical protein
MPADNEMLGISVPEARVRDEIIEARRTNFKGHSVHYGDDDGDRRAVLDMEAVLACLDATRRALDKAQRERDEANTRLARHHSLGIAWYSNGTTGELHCQACGITSAEAASRASQSTSGVKE